MTRWTATALVTAAVVLAACSDSISPQGSVSLSFSGSSASAPAPSAPGLFASAAADPFTDGLGNILDITQATIVLREIELKRIEVVDCDVVPEPEGCEEFEAGPLALDLPLDGSIAQRVTISAPPGTYDEVEFEIHKVSSDSPEDASVRLGRPEMTDQSIRVEGTYNGTLFVFMTDLDVEQEFDLPDPIVVSDMSGGTNVTVKIDLSKWFLDLSGNLVDPDTGNKGGLNQSLINENIKQSIEAFEDRDRDGDLDS